MKPELIIHSDILDILFENRNKDYGAYQLRKQYQKRLLSAISSTVLLVSFSILIFKLAPEKRSAYLPAFTSKDTVKLIDLAPPKNLVPPELPAARPKAASIDNATYVITKENIADTIPTIAQLINTTSNIDVVTTVGPPPERGAPSSQGDGQGKVSVPEPEAAEPETKILERAESMPQYPGGVEALRRFLGKHLRVPEEEMEPGQRILVDVRFVVDTTGVISDIQFPAFRSEPFEKEVKRVIGKMPRWTAGSQNGKKVNVYFSIPVIFEVPE